MCFVSLDVVAFLAALSPFSLSLMFMCPSIHIDKVLISKFCCCNALNVSNTNYNINCRDC